MRWADRLRTGSIRRRRVTSDRELHVVTDAERLADILRYTPGACLILDRGEIKGANAEAVNLTGIPRKRLVGAGLVELAIDEHHEAIQKAVDGASDVVSSARMRLAGGLRPLEISIRRLNDSLTLVGLRSVAAEHELSAAGGGELTHDIVTGLPDRYHILEQLQRRLALPHPQPLALIGLWIDELATLEEEQGERVTERIIRQVGERVQARLRGPDLLGRLDDSGFLVLLTTDSDLDQLKEIADRLRAEVSFPVDCSGTLVSFTSSVMVGSLNKKRPSLERVLARLDSVGKKAAANGGNRTELFSL